MLVVKYQGRLEHRGQHPPDLQEGGHCSARCLPKTLVPSPGNQLHTRVYVVCVEDASLSINPCHLNYEITPPPFLSNMLTTPAVVQTLERKGWNSYILHSRSPDSETKKTIPATARVRYMKSSRVSWPSRMPQMTENEF